MEFCEQDEMTSRERMKKKCLKKAKYLRTATKNAKSGITPSVKNLSKQRSDHKSKTPAKSKAEPQSKSVVDAEWAGRSAVIKFFSTEVSDDEDRASSPSSPTSLGRDLNSPTEASTYRATCDSHEKQSNCSPSNSKPDRETFDERHPSTNSKASKVNIDSLSGDNGSSDLFNSFYEEPFTVIRHRPTVSAKIAADYFVPKMQTPRTETPRTRNIRRHNCNDEHDVTRMGRKEKEPKHTVYPRPCPPLSVISERFQENIFTPVLPEEELYRFGDVYEANLLHHIHKYLEVDTFHRVVYIGPEKGSIATQVEKQFCLVKGILSVFPGKIDYKDVEENYKLLAFKIAHVGAEDFFAQASNDPAYQKAPFDRVIIHDAIQYFHDLETTLQNIMKVLHQFGKILVIHRPGNLSTLPYFDKAKKRMEDNDTPYMKIINSLQKTGADVEWDLVHVPIVVQSSKWLAMLKAKYPAQMEIMSNYEITCGLRELAEGPLKYLQGGDMEVEDRLMFITASLSSFDCAYPSVQRVGGASQVPYSGVAEAKYQLPITEDIAHLLPKSQTSQYKMKSLF